MSAPTAPERPIDRRFLMRGGAILAGAAGLAALAPTADAATGQFMVVGQPNSADLSTSITENGAPPTLSLVNSSGPTLKLNPLSADFDTPLAVGEIANTEVGPVIGVDVGDGPENTKLATGFDLEGLPWTYPVGPFRILDTRTSEGRSRIIATSTGALDASHRLRSGQWLDIAVAPADIGFSLIGCFLNVTVAKPTGSGYALVYPPGERPDPASTVNFVSGITLSNSAFVGTATVEDSHTVRIYTTRTTHVVLDLTGATVAETPTQTTAANRRAMQRRAAHEAKFTAGVQRSVGSR
jgi:hypothetical protein